MKKTSKLLFFALTIPLVTGCTGLLPKAHSSNNDYENDSNFGESLPVDKTYVISWLNWDGSYLDEAEYVEGEWPEYHGAMPSRPSENGINYEFIGWQPEITQVLENKSYIAQYNAIAPEYEPPIKDEFTAKWVNWDGTVLQEEVYKQGKTPSYKGTTPTRPNDGDIHYEFTGWSPAIGPIYSDTTYVAIFESSYAQSSFEVTWLNWDGTVLETFTYPAGQMPEYHGEEPRRSAEGNIGFAFSGWAPEVVEVTENATYIAQFDMDGDNIEYAVTWYNADGSFLAQDYYKKGEMPAYKYDTPTRDPSVENTYAFIGWEPEVTAVTKSASYRAVYESATRQYEVRWHNADNSVIYTETVDYGSLLHYHGAVPTKEPTVSLAYTFTRWSETHCYGNIDVYPQFESSTRQYKITWANDDGSVIKEDWVNYGTRPSYSGETPTKEPEGPYSYGFSGWSPSTTIVTGDATYVAQYYTNTRYVTYSFLNNEGQTMWSWSYKYGDTVNINFDSYQISQISKGGDAEHYYDFVGWDKEIPTVAEDDVTFTPVFEARNCIDDLALKLSIDRTHYVVIGFKNIPSCRHIGIPAEYNGLPIQEIGASAFENCNLNSVVMSNSVIKVNNRAFVGNSSANITLSCNLKEIGDSAFWNNYCFTDLDLSNIERIGDSAFYACWDVQNVILGPSLVEIGPGVFAGGGTNFVVDSNNDYFKTIDGAVYSKDGKELLIYPVKKTVSELVIPYGVEKIGYKVFYNSPYLQSITLPDGLKEIGYYAFGNAEYLKQINIPNTVTVIGEGAFSYCQQLETVTLSSSIKNLQSCTFDSCESLTSIVIPEGVETISNNAFTRCTKLKSVVIPNTVTYIDAYAFNYCQCLESVSLPDSITRLRYGTFSDCRSLTSVVIPEGVTSIESLAFNNCLSLDEVTIPSTLTYIDGGAFAGCTYLYQIRFNGSVEQWESLDKSPYWKDDCGVQFIICVDGTITLD